MFYEPQLRDHGLPHDPFKALVVPRPIGWISTISADGTSNLAPYSFFNICSSDPHMVMFSGASRKGADPRKDSQRNAETTGCFVVNLVSRELGDIMNRTAFPHPYGLSEANLEGLALLPSIKVAAPRVACSPAHLECEYYSTVVLPKGHSGEHSSMVIGRVVGIHIDPAILIDGLVDITRLEPLARLGYQDYAAVNQSFTMKRPR